MHVRGQSRSETSLQSFSHIFVNKGNVLPGQSLNGNVCSVSQLQRNVEVKEPRLHSQAAWRSVRGHQPAMGTTVVL